MTLTKTLTKTKTKTKTKSNTKTAGAFPAEAWDLTLSLYVELPRFFVNPAWQRLQIDLPPGPAKTEEELDHLYDLQTNMSLAGERRIRRPEIQLEEQSDPPAFRRLLLYAPGSATDRLVQSMVLVGAIVAAHYKHRFNRPRPSQLDPRLRPVLDPRHPSYPSGHALQWHLVAKALASVCRNQEVGEELFKIAERVARNREWAGLHYPSDTDAGRQLAFQVFPYAAAAYADTFRDAAEEWL